MSSLSRWGERHVFRALPDARPALVPYVNEVRLRDRLVAFNHVFPGKTVRLMMVAVHESGYPRVDVAATALRGRACCSRPISLVSTRPRMQARRLAIPVELGMTTISPASEGAQKRFLGAWFSHVSEFSVTDA